MNLASNKIYRIVLWILLIIMMIVIFSFSNQPSTDSAELSHGLVEKLINFLSKFFDLKEKAFDNIHTIIHFVRKSAHFCLYCILGMIAFSLSKAYLLKKYKHFVCIVIAEIYSVIYAITDEFHQLFIPGRSGELRDVCIDSCGALTGILIVILVGYLINKVIFLKKSKKVC